MQSSKEIIGLQVERETHNQNVVRLIPAAEYLTVDGYVSAHQHLAFSKILKPQRLTVV